MSSSPGRSARCEALKGKPCLGRWSKKCNCMLKERKKRSPKRLQEPMNSFERALLEAPSPILERRPTPWDGFDMAFEPINSKKRAKLMKEFDKILEKAGKRERPAKKPESTQSERASRCVMQKGKECEGYWTKKCTCRRPQDDFIAAEEDVEQMLSKSMSSNKRREGQRKRERAVLDKYEQIGMKQKELDDEALMRQEEEELQRQAAMREKQRKMWTLNRRIRGE